MQLTKAKQGKEMLTGDVKVKKMEKQIINVQSLHGKTTSFDGFLSFS